MVRVSEVGVLVTVVTLLRTFVVVWPLVPEGTWTVVSMFVVVCKTPKTVTVRREK